MGIFRRPSIVPYRRAPFLPSAPAASATAAFDAAAGAATAQTLTGGAVFRAAFGAAAGAATAQAATGAATTRGAFGAAAASATAATLTARVSVTPAAGVATAQALTGSSTARAAIGAAAGAATAQALAGRSTARAALGAASGAATASGLAIETNGYSLRFFGSDPATYPDVDHVRIPLRSGADRTPVDVGDSDFTYEWWMLTAYADNTTTSTSDWRYSNIVFDRDVWNGVMGHGVGVTRSGSDLVVVLGVAGAGLTHTSIATTSNVGDGAWHHIAVTRQQSTGVIRIYVDGTEEASGTYSTGDLRYDGSNAGGQNNDQIVLGREKHDLGYGFNGRLDEVRISNSRRYTGTFTRPARPFSTDANTMALYHADSATGTTLADSAYTTGAPTNGTLYVGGPSSGPVWSPVVPFAPGGAGIAVAAGAATAQTLTGSGLAAGQGAFGVAAAALTAATLAGGSTARASLSAAAGAATTAATGAARFTAAIAAAAASATAQTATGSATGRGALGAAAGVLAAATLTGGTLAGSTATISPAAGLLTAQALAGSSTARAALVAAAGALTGATLSSEQIVGLVRLTLTTSRPSAGFATRRPSATFTTEV